MPRRLPKEQKNLEFTERELIQEQQAQQQFEQIFGRGGFYKAVTLQRGSCPMPELFLALKQ